MRNSLIYLQLSIAALLTPCVLAAPTLAQNTQLTTLTPEDAMTLMQSEAAVQLNTFLGNTEITEFSSSFRGDVLEGYTATVGLQASTTNIFCSIDLNALVQCTSSTISSPTNPNSRCAPNQTQQTLLDLAFTQNLSNTLNDYSVRIYYNTDAVHNMQHLCMNVYNILNESFVGSMPVRSSFDVTAYYTEQPLDGFDYQITLSPDNRYIFRRSQGTSLIYEGLSRQIHD